jgi:hemoglobin
METGSVSSHVVSQANERMDPTMNHEQLSEHNLKSVVDVFYNRVRADPMLGPVFNGAISDWPDHLSKLQAFWSSVMLTTGRYKGRPLPAHIKHANVINSASFTRWLEIWKVTTDEILPVTAASAMQEKAARIAESLSIGIQLSLAPQRPAESGGGACVLIEA